ncbi:PAQR family membrane homeostasis protein TrhA [Azotosporobacter soli]|uniref:PAQR family membrane homeostasis protein TrhA n=1 Tax=Azotosporobacter soli TaxID=3055040 RepID=UPI0031FF1E1E
MEERINALTHGVGTALSVVGLITLAVAAYHYHSVWHQMSVFIYGGSLVLLYLASTLYHSFKDEKIKYRLKIFDHSAIYLLIAGTYTPFTLIPLHGTLGWSIFGIVWTVACIGIVLKLFYARRFKLLSTLCYLAMGWFIVLAIKPLAAALPDGGMSWLVAGGVFYTVGAVFYLWRRMPYNHAVWHLFVMAGSAAHFVAVLYYVLPLPVAV